MACKYCLNLHPDQCEINFNVTIECQVNSPWQLATLRMENNQSEVSWQLTNETYRQVDERAILRDVIGLLYKRLAHLNHIDLTSK
jgi:hypothetical protein